MNVGEAIDLANIQQVKAISIKTLIEAGFRADAVIEAVTVNDLTRLKGQNKYV